jgi:hypothetical protein
VKNFIATKRVGSILTANEPLTWLEATGVLEVLGGDAGDEIDIVLRDAAAAFFGTKAKLVGGKVTSADALPAYRSRGQVYHSKRVLLTSGSFKVLLSLSFTVCVRLDVPFLDQPPRTSQSKFWCSAIITCDRTEVDLGEDAEFAELCRQIDNFAPEIREKTQALYGDAVRSVNPRAHDIRPTEDMISTLLFQVEDDDFRDQLAAIESGTARLSEVKSDTAIGLLNRMYSGRHFDAYLHRGRDEPDPEAAARISVDAISHSDRLRARAFLIETRKRNGQSDADWRFLGATSAAEPVEHDPDKMTDEVYRLVHSPANVLSAEIAAEIGEQF